MFKFHHIGYTVADIQATAQQFSHFGYQAGPVLYDEALQVELCYLTPEVNRNHKFQTSRSAEGRLLPTGRKNFKFQTPDATIELIHQLNPQSLEVKLLSANGVIPYHLAYEADDFDRACATLDSLGYRRLFDPVPVAALGGIRICYFHHPAIGYIELLE